MGNAMEVSVIHHICIVFLLLWLLSSYNCCHPLAYLISLIYLYLVHDRYVLRLRRKIQFEERRQSNKKRVLSDSETVRWLNHAVEKMWPVCMEQIVSQKILLPIVPWFLQKYKPWTVKDATVQHLYMGRSPPMFTEFRVLKQSCDDDHLVLELGMNFLTANDMSAILAVKLRRRIGLGMWAKLHLTGMHVEGRVLVGVKFLRSWPFIRRLRVCFVEPPYFQMTVKPLVSHGLDVTEFPGIAGWLDKLLSVAFEETLVEPNMLVVDVEKFASPEPENWFSVNAKEALAHVLVEILEASDLKPSDMNGLADPYIKGKIGPYRFRSKMQRKTLSPKWQEEFKIPICSWESTNVLHLEVRDKDHFVDDSLGDCSICIHDFRDGQRHDMWLSLQNIKMGRLHLAITVIEVDAKEADQPFDDEPLNNEKSFVGDPASRDSISASSEMSSKVADEFEPIDVEGQQKTGIWVHRPGTEVAQVWEPRKGKDRLADNVIQMEQGDTPGSCEPPELGSYSSDSNSSDESQESNKKPSRHRVRRGIDKVKSVFRKSIEVPVLSPNNNTNSKGIGVEMVMEDDVISPASNLKFRVEDNLPTSTSIPKVEGMDNNMYGIEPENPSKGHMKIMAKSILKHAGDSARGLKNALSRKGSIKSQCEPESIPAGRDVPIVSDSVDRESADSPDLDPQTEMISAVNPVSGSGNDCNRFEDHTFHTPDQHAPVDTPVDKVNVEGGISNSPHGSEGNDDVLVQ